MDKKPSLTLIIPCYNEEQTLRACIEKCLDLQAYLDRLELIIVDDCSTDASYAVACALAQQHAAITVLRHEKNRGKGAALRTGFTHATCDFVGVQDADAEYTPLDYVTLLAPLQDGRADVVYGSRYLRQDTRRVLYFWHTWMNRSLTFISNMFTNLDISDMETCYKVFRRDIVQRLVKELKEDRFGFEPEITCLVAKEHLRVYECAIHYHPRTYEEGKKIGWKDGIRALYCILHYGAPHAPLPMQIIIYLGIGILCALANIVLFAAAYASGLPLLAATWTAFLLAAALNYLLCLAILFRHKARWSAPKELLAYGVTLVVMGSLDAGMTWFFTFLGLTALWSKIWATVLGFIGNFLFRKYLVF